MSGVFRAHEQRRGYLDAVAENTGRHVILNGSFYTYGVGEVVNPDPFDFGVILTERPNVSYSYSVDDEDLVDSVWPRCWGGICGWITDDKGMYTGANAFVVIDTSPLSEITYAFEGSPTPPNYGITHFFTFNGIALKFASSEDYGLLKEL